MYNEKIIELKTKAFEEEVKTANIIEDLNNMYLNTERINNSKISKLTDEIDKLNVRL